MPVSSLTWTRTGAGPGGRPGPPRARQPFHERLGPGDQLAPSPQRHRQLLVAHRPHHEHARLDPAGPQLGRLAGRRHREHPRPAGERRARRRQRPVPVAAALHDRAQAHAIREPVAQPCDVAFDRGEVHAGQRAHRHG